MNTVSGPDASRAPTGLPDALVEILDTLDAPALRDVAAYVDRRIEESHTPLAERVLAAADGDVVDVDDRGSYTLVRKRLSGQAGPGADSGTVALYHVTWETPPDGEETLRWHYLGDVLELPKVACSSCGAPLDERADSCPNCGHETGRLDTEE